MFDEKIKAKNIFIDIDALFDTRLPLLYTLCGGGNEVFKANMKTYYERMVDEFNPISRDIFESYYKNLNKSIFKLAAPTEMFDFVLQLAIEMKEDLSLLGENEVIDIYVNIGKYNFNSGEIINITNAITSVLNLEYVKIKLVKMGNDALTPEWIKDNVYAIIKYDGMEWLEYQIATYSIVEQPLVDTLLVIPALLKSNGEIQKINKQSYNEIFKDTTLVMSTLITINFVKVEYFSTKV